MSIPQTLKLLLGLAVLAGLAIAGYLTRETWLPWLHHSRPHAVAEPPETAEAPAAITKVIVSEQGQKNLGITARPLNAGTAWKYMEVPGLVVDRPGVSDRGVAAPVTGIVSEIHHAPGDLVRPGDALFTLKLLSESLHQTQTDLFKAAQDIELAQVQKKLLEDSGGAIPRARIVEVESQITRSRVAVRAYRQELLNRGLSPEAIDAAAGGRFASTITIPVPARAGKETPPAPSPARPAAPPPLPVPLEVQELKVELGQQVQAGQTLCMLASHQALSIEGRAFPDEAGLVERSVREGWPVAVDFQDSTAGWPSLGQPFRVLSVANSIDPATRTFAFHLPLANQSHEVETGGRKRMLWRFRPGQRAWLRLRTEEVKDVFALPPEAVVRDGAEAFVFTRNVNTFERKGVRVLFQDGGRVVIANDGSLPTYRQGKDTFTIPAIALAAAPQLNRMAKAGTGGVPKGYHVHADGSLHKNEDEGK